MGAWIKMRDGERRGEIYRWVCYHSYSAWNAFRCEHTLEMRYFTS